MTPSILKKPVWLVPLLVFCLSMGMFLNAVMFIPGFNPSLQDGLTGKNLLIPAILCSFMCIAIPVVSLWYGVYMETHKQNEKDDQHEQ